MARGSQKKKLWILEIQRLADARLKGIFDQKTFSWGKFGQNVDFNLTLLKNNKKPSSTISSLIMWDHYCKINRCDVGNCLNEKTSFPKLDLKSFLYP